MSISALIAGAVGGFEVAGVVTMILGTLLAAGLAAVDLRRVGGAIVYRCLRRRIGRAILLGLELLVAADIIRTISEQPTLMHVVTLAGIVLIRTFLSFVLEVELDGRWPWRRVAP